MLFRRPTDRHLALTPAPFTTGLGTGASDEWRGKLLRHAIGPVAVVVGVMAMSACALHPLGLFDQADAHYRSGLKALVADPPDYDKALSHLRKAAIRDHADAQRQLGRLYTSWSPEPDLVRGYLWLFLAARSDPEAANELIYLTRVMTREQVGKARAWAAGFVPGQAPDEPPEADSPAGTAEEQAARPEPDAGA